MTENYRFSALSNCVCVRVSSPQIAVRLLVHKFFAQEWEALQALTVRGVLMLIHHYWCINSLFMMFMCLCRYWRLV